MISFLANTRFANKPQIDLMLETSTSKEIRICMDQGNLMHEHTAPGAITIMVLEGAVVIASDERRFILHQGDMLFFDANVPHSLEALARSVVRLSLAKHDTIERVNQLL